ncbi:MAG: helix-turn-helix domain-containing protein [Eubacteriales bacterium]
MQIRLGEQIREFRRRDGRTQEELANALGVTAQAVSRWEKGICYPDMELMPSMANFFGVSIDELFGYSNERSKKVDALAEKINEMNRKNNGVDLNIEECIRLAREALVEFPGNEKIMLCLASVLYNAGYVRYGEYHLIDADGYGVYDAERHRGYPEWKEAIKLYEKLLTTLEEGKMRHKVVSELTQLYLNTGEHEKALAIADTAPDIYGSRDFLRIKACDGKKHAEAHGKALLKTVEACSGLILGSTMACGDHMTPAEKAESVRSAIDFFRLVCTDGNYGLYHERIARMYMLLSVYLWWDERHDEAFEALDKALEHAKKYDEICRKGSVSYTAPLLRLAEAEQCSRCASGIASELAEDWPWWSVQEDRLVRDEIQADPRWNAWVEKTKS